MATPSVNQKRGALATALLLLLQGEQMTAVSAGWNADRVHHVDALGAAHLFRGPAPVANESTFVFDELRATVQNVARREAGATIPDEFALIVVSLLQAVKPSEGKELKAEEDFFDSLPPPPQGPASAANGTRLVKWPIVGDLTAPSSAATKQICLQHAAQYDSRPDHMVTKTTELRGILETAAALDPPQPTVVYFHCDAGMDRTGEVYGDYKMMYGNQTYEQVYAYDNTIEGPGGRKIHDVSNNALEWMCLYLQQQPGAFDPQCNKCQ